MQVSKTIAVNLSTGNLNVSINAVLAEVSTGYTSWRIVGTWASQGSAYILFVRDAIPAGGNTSPYVTG